MKTFLKKEIKIAKGDTKSEEKPQKRETKRLIQEEPAITAEKTIGQKSGPPKSRSLKPVSAKSPGKEALNRKEAVFEVKKMKSRFKLFTFRSDRRAAAHKRTAHSSLSRHSAKKGLEQLRLSRRSAKMYYGRELGI